MLIAALLLGACGEGAGPPDTPDPELRQLLAGAGVTQLPPLPAQDPALVTLGRALMFDKELSGNRDVSCATCHDPAFHSSDGLSLSIGSGGVGAGATRELGTAREFVSRNAQDLFNRGYPEFTSMFWDGRVARRASSGFDTPAGVALPDGLSGPLAAQAMFPVFTRLEMRGQPGDHDRFGAPNELAALADDPAQVWAALMDRLLAIDGYVALFQAAYPGRPPDQLGFQDAANAIAAFEATGFTSSGSPFDDYLRGADDALSPAAKRGAVLFFGDAGCAQCHRGPHLSDQRFHNIGVPQLGPGFAPEEPQDFGRGGVTGAAGERYLFRTPPLRNVALTGPWMHDGAYTTLAAAVRHYRNAHDALGTYDASGLRPELRGTYLDDPATLDAMLRTLDPAVTAPLTLSDPQVEDLVAFLDALTDPAAADLDALVPTSVPSGLPVRE
ncbi:MAG TPA: cytochrome c peroxidase [Gemmatimonadales bacterium]|nr:cytochrome c peroxidase [Gemmatimonadales bacterium]